MFSQNIIYADYYKKMITTMFIKQNFIPVKVKIRIFWHWLLTEQFIIFFFKELLLQTSWKVVFLYAFPSFPAGCARADNS